MSNQPKHTPEPWEWHGGIHPDLTQNGSIVAGENSGLARCVAKAPKYETEIQWSANANRIVSCVNNCKGINPEAVPTLVEMAKAALAWWEEAQFWEACPGYNRFDGDPRFIELAKQAFPAASND